jgi:GAF domain-containing protein
MPMLILSNGTVSSPERAIAVRDNGLAGLVLRERRPLIIDETDTDRRWFSLSAHEYDAPTRCAMAVPLSWGDTVLGVLTVTTTQTHLFDTPQLNLLDLIASHVALALHSALIQVHIRSLSDALEDLAHNVNSALQAAQLNVQLMLSSNEAQGMLLVERDDLLKLGSTLDRIGEAGRRLHALQHELQLPSEA